MNENNDVSKISNGRFTSLELCAGGGGQAIGLELAGFHHVGLVEIDSHCCNTLKANRPFWNVMQEDIKHFDGKPYKGVDLLAGGLPCPPFSVAGKKLGNNDERDLFPDALRLVKEIKPLVLFIENVRGFLESSFSTYRGQISEQLETLGYKTDWRLLYASDYLVPQLRPRTVLIALNKKIKKEFIWPSVKGQEPPTVGEAIYDLMASRGWKKVDQWKKKANKIAPTIVGGSKKHGGPDLGPVRARKAWAELCVDGIGVANEPPPSDYDGMPKLTVPMVARIQGFPDYWIITGKKTPAYRQVGNAFPPPVAEAVGNSIYTLLSELKR